MVCTGESHEPGNSCSLKPGWERVTELRETSGQSRRQWEEQQFGFGKVFFFQIL